MDLKLLMSNFSDVKYNLNFTEDIERIVYGGPKKGAINIISEEDYSSEKRGFTYIILSEKEDYLQDRHNNIILVKEDLIFPKLNRFNEILQENENFYKKILYGISKGDQLPEIMKAIKEYFHSNLCVLSSGQKLIYNVFDFTKVTSTFPLEVRINRMTRRYAYFGFESLDEIYEEEMKKLTGLVGPLLYEPLRKLVNQGAAFYDVLKNLIRGSFDRNAEEALDIIDWGLKDDYTMIVGELVGGMYKYQEMFVHGNRFKYDHPMFMYSSIVDNRLVLLMNESFKDLRHVKKESREMLDEFNMKYMEIGLKNDLRNCEKAYNIADVLLSRDIVPEGKPEESLCHLIYDLIDTEHDLSIILPPEIDAIIKEDQEYNSELIKTLYYYLLEERSLIKAAECLDVHRNSVVYRVNKIEEIVDIDFDDYVVRRNLMAALEIVKRHMPELF